MNWGKLSEKSTVLTFVITAITAALGLFKWLSSEFPPHAVVSVPQHAIPSAAAGHPALPIILIGMLVLSYCFAGVAHYMARRNVVRPTHSDQRNQSREIRVPESSSFEPSPIRLAAVQTTPLPAMPEPTELAESDKPERADILFAHDSKKGLVWLKFLPDTPHVNEDALLLIVFGCKLITGANEVPVKAAHEALRASGCRNPPPKGLMAALAYANYDPNVDVNEIGRKCVDQGLLYKGRLAIGGSFILTEGGARHALHLARDLIHRA